MEELTPSLDTTTAATTDPLKIVNLPASIPDLVGSYNTHYDSGYDPNVGTRTNPTNPMDSFHNLVNQAAPETKPGFKVVSADQVASGGRYPLHFVGGQDNEEMYAQNQTSMEKAYNGVAKMTGIAASGFVNGTAGLVYGVYKSIGDQKFSSFYDNQLANDLNEWTEGLEDKYAHYKTIRERNGDWWEPSNLFTGNFLFDNIVKNLGFSLGAAAAGFAWGGALSALGLTSRLVGTGVEMAAAADTAIADAALLPQAQRLSSLTQKLNQLYNTSKVGLGGALIKADQGIIATMGSFGEAGMEALGNSKQYREQAINAFRQEHGYDPEDSDLDNINKAAEKVGNWSLGLNVALLTATNYIQLPKIYSSSFKAEKAEVNAIARGAGEVAEDYASTLPKEGFGKLWHKTKNLASLAFNEDEAFEEGAQFAIQTGTQNYFDKKYKSHEPSVLDDGLLYGVKQAISTGEGTLNIFTGGLSGALQSSGVIGVKNYLPTIGKTGKIGERGWTGYGGEEAVTRAAAVDQFNKTKLKDKFKDMFSSIKQSEQIQGERADAIRRGDIMESKDLEFDYAHSFISTRIKYGAQAFIRDEINDLKQRAITDFTGLQQEGVTAPTDTKESFIARLDNIQQHADHVSKMYDATKLRYSGLVDKQGKRIYSDEVIDKMVYAGSKVMDYDRRIPQLNNELSKYNIGLDNILTQALSGDPKAEDSVLDAQIILEDKAGADAPELSQSLDDIIEASLRRKQYIAEYKGFVTNPSAHEQTYAPDSAPITPPTPGNENLPANPNIVTGSKVGDKIDVVTKGGATQLTVGKEYVVGRVVEKDKNGYEVYRSPKMVILGENADGTIKVQQSSDGTIKDVSKEVLEDYKLVTTTRIAGDKKLKYYMANWNNIFEHKNIKVNGVPVKGRLEYSDKDGTLLFVYKDRRGKIISKEVNGWMFKAKEGYKQAMISKVGQVTAAEQQAEDEFIAEKDERAAEVIAKRMNILQGVADEIISNQEKAEKSIANKIKQLESFQKELETLEKILAKTPLDKRFTKGTVRFKKVGRDALKRAMAVNSAIGQLKQEIADQEAQIEDMDNTLKEIEEIVTDIENQPVKLEDFLTKLRHERRVLVEAIQSSAKNINFLQRAVKAAEDLLESTINIIRDVMHAFDTKYPGAPYSITEIENRNPDFLKLNPNFKADLEEFADELELMDELAEVPVKEKNIEDLKDKLDVALKEFKALENQLKAHDAVLDAFKEVLANYRAAKQEEQALAKDEKIVKEMMGSNSNDTEATRNDPTYEPEAKKSWINVVFGTTTPNDKVYDPQLKKYVDRPLREHHKRALRFGLRMGNGEIPVDTIHGQIVTKETEKAAGVPSLTVHLAGGDEKVDQDKIIAMVMMKKDLQGEFQLVDEFGEFLTDEQKKDPKEHAIYQVFPKSELTQWSKGEEKTMFREDVTPEQRTVLVNEYTAWRASVLKQKEPGTPMLVDASFGIPEFVMKKDSKGFDVRDYDVRTSAKDAQLIDEGQRDLLNKKVIHVSTLNETYEQGTTSYKAPFGFTFFETKTGAVKLLNRKFSKNEADNMYNVIRQLAINLATDKSMQTVESDKLLRWMKSVVYWGKPKNDPGHNSIWFDFVEEANGQKVPKLFISGKGLNFSFTKTGVEDNESTIKALLQNMYGNTSATKVREESIHTAYYEITGLDEEGKPIEVKWPNYQSFLLSDKRPDGTDEANLTEPRPNEHIPLITNMAPVRGDSSNRTGIYFIRRDTETSFTEPIPAPIVPKAAPVVKPTVAASTSYDAKKAEIEQKRIDNLKLIDPEGNETTKNNYWVTLKEQLSGVEESIAKLPEGESTERTDLEAQKATLEKGIASLETSIRKTEAVYAQDLAALSKSVTPAAPAPAKVTITQKPVFIPKPGQYDLSGTTINTLPNRIRFRLKEAELLDIIDKHNLKLDYTNPKDPTFLAEVKSVVDELTKSDSIVIDIPMEVGMTMMQANSMTDVDALRFQVKAQIVKTVLPQVFGKSTPVEPAIDSPAPALAVQAQQPTIVKKQEVEPAPVTPSAPAPVVTSVLDKFGTTAVDPNADTSDDAEIMSFDSFGGTPVADNGSPVEQGDVEVAEVVNNTELDDDAPISDEQALEDWNNLPDEDDASPLFREQMAVDIATFKPENWEKLTEWLAKNFPNVPVFRVKNVIKNTNGKQAWGMFQDGAIYVHENAEIGTIYHEVFEAVWKMFATPKEKVDLVEEFKNREGEFRYAFSGEMVKYSEATPEQIKETLAEEFRDFVHFQKEPVRNVKRSIVGQLFHDIVNFINTYFLGREASSNTKKLFDKIGNGYYAKYNPYQTRLALAGDQVQEIENVEVNESAVFRLQDVPEIQAHEVIEHMTFLTLRWILDKRKNIFNEEKQSKKELYTMLKAEILGSAEPKKAGIIKSKYAVTLREKKSGAKSEEVADKEMNDLQTLHTKLTQQWDELVTRHQLYLKQKVQLTFDENDEAEFADEKSNKAFEGDARKIDTFRKANSMIRLMFSTLPTVTSVLETTKDENGADVTSTVLKPKPTSVGGNTLIPGDEVFINLMNSLYSATDPVQMLNRLADIGRTNPSYDLLYQRLTKNPSTKYVSGWDLEKFDQSQLELITAFWKTMNKDKTDVVAVYMFPSGEVAIGDASLASASKQIKKDYINSVINKLKSGPYLEYVGDKYQATKAVKNLSFDNNFTGMIAFLDSLGIPFNAKELQKLNSEQKNIFRDAVIGIRKDLSRVEDVKFINSKTLDIDGSLNRLATLRASLQVDNKFESTYFNLNGERTQAFVGTNPISNFFSTVSQLTNIKQLKDTKYKYLLTDVFSMGSASVMLNKLFDVKGTGARRSGTNELLKRVDVSGIVDEDKGKKKESSKMNYKDRLVQEINLNIAGIYLNLVPGDASIEHAIKMHTEGSAFVSDQEAVKNDFLGIFKNYFMAEVDLARDDRHVVKGRNSNDLRFFKDILPEDVHTAVVTADRKISSEDLYKSFEAKINSAVIEFVETEAKETYKTLEDYGVLGANEEGMTSSGIDFKSEFLNKDIVENKLKAITVNYMIANIEMHKLYYSDPYQYKDELKRIKNFNSPRQDLFHGSKVLNQMFDSVYNRGYNNKDIGWSDMDKEFFNTVTLEDVMAVMKELGYNEPFESTDGGGVMFMNAFRIMRIRSANWTESNENQFRYDIAYEKIVKGLPLTDEEAEFDIKPVEQKDGKIKFVGKNPGDQSTYTTQKPIVTGSKLNDRGYNDIVMDKYALMPLSFRILHEMDPGSNAIKLYNKWQADKTDYGVYASGRKVGTEVVTPLYDKQGNFNDKSDIVPEQVADPTELQTVVKVPFDIMSIQAEIPSKKEAKVTEGSQITQLVTLDFMEAGVPQDFIVKDTKGKVITDFDKRNAAWLALPEDQRTTPLLKEIQKNQKLLEVRVEQGYRSLLKKSGIKANKTGGFYISNRDKLIKTISDEILNREINENIISAFEGIKEGHVILEATPAYKQIRNALYAMADKSVLTKKLKGRMAVQVPVALLENSKDLKATVVKNSKGQDVTVYSSDTLKFYSADKNKAGEVTKVNEAEIMIARWFDSPLSDDDLLKYLNDTPEGQKILQGVAFRIPTQKQNSIDAYKVKKFLPKEFGDNVVIPTALVMKVGSDFDIDKLSMYFKNVKVNKAGFPELVTLLTDENSTPQQRYRKYIQENFSEYGDVISEIKESELGQTVSESFNDAKAGDIELKELQTDAGAAYAKGRVLFSVLPTAIKKVFWDANDNMAGVDMVEKMLKFKDIASDLAGEKKDPDVIKALNRLIKNYTETLTAFGLTEGLQDKVKGQFKEAYALNNQLQEEITNALAEASGMETLEEFKLKDIYSQNTKEAVDNAYMESLFDLITDPLNFERLTIPNSADQLKGLNNKLGKMTGRTPTDYSSTGNMLKRSFMSSLRHAFVTGKYAIGIAAIAQTNHSQNQRSPIVVDPERIKNVSSKDAAWLGDGKINFEHYNSMLIDGKRHATFSMRKNFAGDFISDIIGQFIDGYVDISKGPWIMEMGATPNVAGTWLALIKMGVPVQTVAYFMNQPAIKDYLRMVESEGYSYLFIDNLVEAVMENYQSSIETPTGVMPSEHAMGEMLEAGRDGKLSEVQKAHQRQMLKEFLKYAKISEHLFLVTQGTNYNTANLNDPFLVYQKEKQLEKARKTIISSPDNILDNSHIGTIRKVMLNIRNAFATVLLSDKYSDDSSVNSPRKTLESILDNYVDLQPKEFLKVAQKLVNNLFDFAVQTTGDTNARNNFIKEILVGSESIKSVAEQIMAYKANVLSKPEHPLFNNAALNSLSLQAGQSEDGKVDNLYLVDRDNKVYDQNIIINSFRELKAQLGREGKANLYKKLVGLSILQSGLNPSPINFTALLPYEDFVTNYQETLSKLENNPNLATFKDVNAFERNSWNNTDIVPFKKFFMFQANSGKWYNPNLDFRDKRLVRATSARLIPMVINMSVMSREGNNDIISYSWQDDKYSKEQKKYMRSKSDYSYIKKGLFQKVYTLDENNVRTPVVQLQEVKGKIYTNYVYKAINAWGDSFKAQEFYLEKRKSVLENGYEKFDEVDDMVIAKIMEQAPDADDDKIITTTESALTPEELGGFELTKEDFESRFGQPSANVSQKELFNSSLPKINIYAGTGENTRLSNFALRLFKYKGNDLPEIMFKSVEIAFQKAKVAYADSVTKQPLDVQNFLNDPRPGISSSEAKALGRKIVGLRTSEWDANSSRIMKDLIKQSFEQNSDDLKTLLATGNAELTHTQDKGKWGKEFPRLLMEVRKELGVNLDYTSEIASKGITEAEWNGLTDDEKQNIIDC